MSDLSQYSLLVFYVLVLALISSPVRGDDLPSLITIFFSFVYSCHSLLWWLMLQFSLAFKVIWALDCLWSGATFSVGRVSDCPTLSGKKARTPHRCPLIQLNLKLSLQSFFLIKVFCIQNNKIVLYSLVQINIVMMMQL